MADQEVPSLDLAPEAAQVDVDTVPISEQTTKPPTTNKSTPKKANDKHANGHAHEHAHDHSHTHDGKPCTGHHGPEDTATALDDAMKRLAMMGSTSTSSNAANKNGSTASTESAEAQPTETPKSKFKIEAAERRARIAAEEKKLKAVKVDAAHVTLLVCLISPCTVCLYSHALWPHWYLLSILVLATCSALWYGSDDAVVLID